MRRFNDWLTQKIGDILGSMFFFYGCLIMDLIELPPVIKAHSVVIWVNYLAQTVIQLLALPALQAYQNLQAKSHDEIHGKLDAIHNHLGINKEGDQ